MPPQCIPRVVPWEVGRHPSWRLLTNDGLTGSNPFSQRPLHLTLNNSPGQKSAYGPRSPFRDPVIDSLLLGAVARSITSCLPTIRPQSAAPGLSLCSALPSLAANALQVFVEARGLRIGVIAIAVRREAILRQRFGIPAPRDFDNPL
jgi:hypothetical protein